MIWIAGISLVVGVLVLILTPLFTRPKEFGLDAALREQKLRIADDLAEIARVRASGELSDEDAAARQRALETEARSVFDAERQAKAIAQPQGNRGLIRGLSAALFFILVGNVTAGVYLYTDGWKKLVSGGEEAPGHPGGGGDAPMGQAGGEAMDPSVMVTRLEKRLQENPNDAKGQMMLGRSYIVLEKYTEASKAYMKAAELEPDNIDAKIGLGVATVRMGHPEKAAEIFAAVLKQDADNPDALWFTGMLQVHAKNIDGAKKTYKHLLDITPDEQKSEMEAQINEVMEALNRPGGMPKAQ